MKRYLLIIAVTTLMVTQQSKDVESCKPIKFLTPEELVLEAKYVLVASPIRYSKPPRKNVEMIPELEFSIKSVLKGTLHQKSLIIEGIFSDENDFNPDLVPYTMVRKQGQHGNCFALYYRRNANYLLFLSAPAEGHDYIRRNPSPYWASLAPTNEQLRDMNDPWLMWVREEIHSQMSPNKSFNQTPSAFHMVTPLANGYTTNDWENIILLKWLNAGQLRQAARPRSPWFGAG